MKKYNFSAGPSKLDKTVIEKANQSIIEYENIGLSILEISHRSKEYSDIMEKLKYNLRKLFYFTFTRWSDISKFFNSL